MTIFSFANIRKQREENVWNLLKGVDFVSIKSCKGSLMDYYVNNMFRFGYYYPDYYLSMKIFSYANINSY